MNQTQPQQPAVPPSPTASLSISESVQARVMVASRRKCCLCYYLHKKEGPQKGQIAQLRKDRPKDRSDSSFENLVFLCWAHHDEFEPNARNGQSQNENRNRITSDEILIHRDRLYRELEPEQPKTKAKVKPVSVAPSVSLNLIEQMPTPFRRAIRKTNTNGQFNFLLAPWRVGSLNDDRTILFAYKASNGSDGICRIERIPIRSGRIVVICTQLPANPGNNITNEVEAIAFQVCAQLNVDSAKLIWIEHYPNVQGTSHRWSLVKFQKSPPKAMFTNPSWKVMTLQDWHPLGLRPRG